MGISPLMRQGLQSLRPMVARLEGGCDMEGSNTMTSALAAAITPGYSPEMKSLWAMLVNFYHFFLHFSVNLQQQQGLGTQGWGLATLLNPIGLPVVHLQALSTLSDK